MASLYYVGCFILILILDILKTKGRCFFFRKKKGKTKPIELCLKKDFLKNTELLVNCCVFYWREKKTRYIFNSLFFVDLELEFK